MRTGRLWDAKHPYYAQEGDYFERYARWEDFFEEEGDANINMNLVYRFDWKVLTADDLDEGANFDFDQLCLYFVEQRRARLRSVEIRIERKDRERVEPLVAEYLRPRLQRLLEIWSPLSGVFPSAAEEA